MAKATKAKASANKAPVKRVVAATGAATSTNRLTAKAVENAMAKAIQDAMADGISDPVKIRERMLQAREAARQG